MCLCGTALRRGTGEIREIDLGTPPADGSAASLECEPQPVTDRCVVDVECAAVRARAATILIQGTSRRFGQRHAAHVMPRGYGIRDP